MTPDDAPTIARHREPLPPEATEPERARVQASRRAYAAWVRAAVERGTYHGVLGLQGGVVVAGAGLVFLEWGPTPQDPNPLRARVSNVFTEPQHRRRGWARRLVLACLDEARARGVRVVTLSASEEARGLYEALGFRSSTTEMLRVEPPA